jgi:hypothetical protein
MVEDLRAQMVSKETMETITGRRPRFCIPFHRRDAIFLYRRLGLVLGWVFHLARYDRHVATCSAIATRLDEEMLGNRSAIGGSRQALYLCNL